MEKEFDLKVGDRFVSLNPEMVGRIETVGDEEVCYVMLASGDKVFSTKSSFVKRIEDKTLCVVEFAEEGKTDEDFVARGKEFAATLRASKNPNANLPPVDENFRILTMELDEDLLEKAYAIGLADAANNFLVMKDKGEKFVPPTREECMDYAVRKSLENAFASAKKGVEG